MSLLRYYRLLDSGLFVPQQLERRVNDIATGTGTSNLGDTGYGFTPKCGILFATGRNSTIGAAAGSLVRGVGFFAGATDRRSVVAVTGDNTDPVACAFGHRDDAVFTRLSSAGTAAGRLDIASLDSNGITWARDEAFAADTAITYCIWGGNGVLEAQTFGFQEPSTSGAQTQTVNFPSAFGAAPDVIFLLATPTATAAPTSFGTGHNAYTLGAASGTGASDQFVMGGGDRAGVTTSVVRQYCRMGQVVATFAGDLLNLDGRASLSGKSASGFDLNWLSCAGSQRWIHGLAIRGGQWKLLNTSYPTAAVSGAGFTPRGLLAWCNRLVEAADNTVNSSHYFNMGAATGPSNRRTSNCGSGNAQATAATGRGWTNALILQQLTFNGNVQSSTDLGSLDADGATLQYSGAPTANHLIPMMLFR